MLLDTEQKLLVEHTENDCYWADGGDCGNYSKGKNMLGFTLMKVRHELQKTQQGQWPSFAPFLDFFLK